MSIEKAPDECEHPLSRIVWRDGVDVWCWACRTVPDEPRHLTQPEAWLVIERWRAMEGRHGGSLFRRLFGSD